VESLEREYKGTVYFDRYILGLWQRAEGIIYRAFADNPQLFTVKTVPRLAEINIGMDFGGTKSKHALVATAHTPGYKEMYALMSERHETKDTTAVEIDRMAVNFVEHVIKEYGRVDHFYWDNESSVLGRGVDKAIRQRFPQVSVRPCAKPPVKDRIDLVIRLMGLGRFFITGKCETLKEALCEAVWDEDEEDTRLDDYSTPIDDLDAWEYSWTERMRNYVF
jgi:hypothetical protein